LAHGDDGQLLLFAPDHAFPGFLTLKEQWAPALELFAG
jgi:hypothetical protein